MRIEMFENTLLAFHYNVEETVKALNEGVNSLELDLQQNRGQKFRNNSYGLQAQRRDAREIHAERRLEKVGNDIV